MATVPKTVKTYNLNGSLKDFAVNFEYLARKFVVVTLLGATRKELVIGVDYRFTTPTQITTTVAEGPGTGYDLIEIRRVTSATDRLVDFADGSILRAYDLNTSQIQSLHIAEEARDLTADVIAINAEGQLDARGKKIQNLSDGTEPGDAVTLRQNQTWAQSTLGNRNAAEAAANLAVASRDTASNAQSIATAQAGIATTKATESEASAVRSENAAGTIGNNVTLAQQARAGAESARDVTVAAAVSVQGAGIPSAAGNALKCLRQKAGESGLEYVWAIDALRTQVLGPVAQVAGIPTGAIIERGINANGSYTRWADGTQICSVKRTLPSAQFAALASIAVYPNPQTWTFPVPFSAAPSCSATGADAANMWTWGTTANASAASVTFNVLGTNTIVASPKCDLLSIGSWF